jgi:hypothetical protein
MALIVPIFAYIAFKKGYELGVRDWNRTHPDEPKSLPPQKPKKTTSASDNELKKLRTIMENIENYDGTDAHQKEVK